jgi:hypothetical protein
MKNISCWSVGLKTQFPFIALPANSLDTANRASALVTLTRLAQEEQPRSFGATYSVVQFIAAAVRTISAGITMYNTPGDQFDRYGYSAFGLTVVPISSSKLAASSAHLTRQRG